jgi:hypothetical protein
MERALKKKRGKPTVYRLRETGCIALRAGGD